MFSSPLRRAITRGMKPDGDLADELRKLGDYSIRSKKDAKAICEALSALPTERSSGKSLFSSPLYALTSLFQDVDGCDVPAFEVLSREGLPQLIRVFDERFRTGNEDDADNLLFVLKILAMYGSREGAEKVVEAARRPLDPEAYMWHVILALVSGGHPQRDYVFRALADPLPSGFLAVAFLDSANGAAIDGGLQEHPFDSQAGWNRLQSWLEDSDPDHASYAHSATAALPFISNPARDQLLALAMEHSDTGVQMEAAWAAGKLGREGGMKVLARFCLDVSHSDVAQRYLAELNREDLVPAEAKAPAFRAKAEFARWLAHPNELGRPPDELEIVDHRQLAWPPERQLQPFWLIRYRLRDRTGLEEDDVDCGLVGSTTWCFFSYKMHQRPPEDAYAIHCYWEMEHADLIDENEVTDASEYAGLLGQWQGAPIESPTITRVAELSPKLQTAGRFVALASARQDGQDGWVVLDGPRSTWYLKSEQPDETHESVVLRIHVGRQLLGFQDPPDRKKHLVTDRPYRSPQDYIAAYEKLLSEASESAAERQKELLGSWSLLARHFDGYVDALVEVDGDNKSDTVIRVYGRFLELAATADRSIRDEAYGSHSVLGENFDKYVDALVSRERFADVVESIETFAPHWDHNLGYGRLGSAAFKAGNRKIAEPFLLKVREGRESYHRSEEMSMLAEIWHERGDVEKARELLADCLRKLVLAIKESKYNSDRKMFAEEFRHHRLTYLRLFPQGEKELAELGIPTEPL
ncbi:MAG: hypothetical protein GXX96_39265 [Planctomycetaceae bacterium]|nr:hypothetical protein [Planctomycetaceae bacterium]